MQVDVGGFCHSTCIANSIEIYFYQHLCWNTDIGILKFWLWHKFRISKLAFNGNHTGQVGFKHFLHKENISPT